MCEIPFLGRRGTMVIGALVTSMSVEDNITQTYILLTMTVTFFFAYTQVRTAAQNLGFSCAISFCLNIYYGTLYVSDPTLHGDHQD